MGKKSNLFEKNQIFWANSDLLVKNRFFGKKTDF
jgi:hypothetical protein